MALPTGPPIIINSFLRKKPKILLNKSALNIRFRGGYKPKQ